MKANNGYTIFETFVGAGGSHLGFMQENFRTVYANDFVDDCLTTLAYNNPNLELEGAYLDNTSIVDIVPHELRKKLNVDIGEIDVFFGGIVCKGFSLAGERSPNDERNYFYHKQLDLVAEFKPKISIIENVPGILKAKVLSADSPFEIKEKVNNLWKELENYKGKKAELRKKNSITNETIEEGKLLRIEKELLLKELNDNKYLVSVIDDIKNIYAKLGYAVYIKTLNSAWYGAATKRERVIIVAIRSDITEKFIFPEPKFMDESIFKKGMDSSLIQALPNPKTVNEALSSIDYSIEDSDNIPMNHSPKTVERFKYIPEGDSIANHIDELPEELKISKFYSRGSTMRLAGDKPSPTLVPGHSNFPVHPKENRSITVREAATITGFPLNYKFFGNHSKRCEHVGNAVPPALSRELAKKCNIILDHYYTKQ